MTAHPSIVFPGLRREAARSPAPCELPGFTTRYGCKRLVWYEPHDAMGTAIQRETSLNRWKRDWKITLIERDNPESSDLYKLLNR